MIRTKFSASFLMVAGKFSENISSTLMTKPSATKLLTIIASSSSWLIARIRTISVHKGEIICMTAKAMLIILPLLPPCAVFTYFMYLNTLSACLTSSKIIMCRSRAQISLIAVDYSVGILKSVVPNSNKKKAGTKI